MRTPQAIDSTPQTRLIGLTMPVKTAPPQRI